MKKLTRCEVAEVLADAKACQRSCLYEFEHAATLNGKNLTRFEVEQPPVGANQQQLPKRARYVGVEKPKHVKALEAAGLEDPDPFMEGVCCCVS